MNSIYLYIKRNYTVGAGQRQSKALRQQENNAAVIASRKAKQSRNMLRCSPDCFAASRLAMTQCGFPRNSQFVTRNFSGLLRRFATRNDAVR
jgi:hypothetical protein